MCCKAMPVPFRYALHACCESATAQYVRGGSEHTCSIVKAMISFHRCGREDGGRAHESMGVIDHHRRVAAKGWSCVSVILCVLWLSAQ